MSETGEIEKIAIIMAKEVFGSSWDSVPYDDPSDLNRKDLFAFARIALREARVPELRAALQEIAVGHDGSQTFSGTNCQEIAVAALLPIPSPQ